MGGRTGIAPQGMGVSVAIAGGRRLRLPDGNWQILFQHALALIGEIRVHGTPDPFWTLGGGTVLMFRYGHRRSKDIDIFVPDPQYLGFVSPRLSDAAEQVAIDYVEGASFVKLIRPEGEIDFVAAPNLTDASFEEWRIGGVAVRVETSAEIIAKKMWHRGDTATARDLFDLSLVIEREPEPLVRAGRFLVRHRESFLVQLERRERVLRSQFAAIDTLAYTPSFDDAAGRVSEFLAAL